MELAPQAGLTVAEEAMTSEESQSADELFIAVTTMDIVPVVQFDGAKIGTGQPGRYTKALMEAFSRFVVSFDCAPSAKLRTGQDKRSS